jgi:hypothetical protein
MDSFISSHGSSFPLPEIITLPLQTPKHQRRSPTVRRPKQNILDDMHDRRKICFVLKSAIFRIVLGLYLKSRKDDQQALDLVLKGKR